VDIDYWSGSATLDQEKAGGRCAADLVLQLPARGAGSVALHSAFIDSTEHLVDAIALGYEVIVLRYKSNQASVLSLVHLASINPTTLLGRADEVIE
jgi:hypothetical protein